MPKVEIELREVADVPKLRKNEQFLRDAHEMIRLTEEEKEVKEKIKQLRPGLREPMEQALRENEKSVKLGGHRLTLVEPENGRRYLDTKKLLKYISATKLEKCYSTAEPGEPYVMVAQIRDSGVVAQVKKKLRKGMEED